MSAKSCSRLHSQALSVPAKLREDCPQSSRSGQEPPLWQTATIAAADLLRIVPLAQKELTALTPESRAATWSSIVGFIESAVNPTSSLSQSADFALLQKTQVFDLLLLSVIEQHVFPQLIDGSVPSETVSRLAHALVGGSKLYLRDELGYDRVSGRCDDDADLASADGKKSTQSGSWRRPAGLVAPPRVTPRELSAYWTFELLFLAAQQRGEDGASESDELSKVGLPILLQHCKTLLQGFCADAQLRGSMPLQRVRYEEANWVLARLLSLRTQRTAVEGFVPLSQHLGASVAQSSRAHLLPLYSCFVDLLGLKASAQHAAGAAQVGSSIQLLAPVELPEDFELGTVALQAEEQRQRRAGGQTATGHKLGPDAQTTSQALARECLAAVGSILGLP